MFVGSWVNIPGVTREVPSLYKCIGQDFVFVQACEE